MTLFQGVQNHLTFLQGVQIMWFCTMTYESRDNTQQITNVNMCVMSSQLTLIITHGP